MIPRRLIIIAAVLLALGLGVGGYAYREQQLQNNASCYSNRPRLTTVEEVKQHFVTVGDPVGGLCDEEGLKVEPDLDPESSNEWEVTCRFSKYNPPLTFSFHVDQCGNR